MEQRDGSADPTRTAHVNGLNCIQPCIHSAAPIEGADPLEGMEIENFLDTLVEVAFAIAARTAKQDIYEEMK